MGDYKIGVVGCAGRMGRMLLQTIAETEGCEIAGGTEAKGNPAVGRDAGVLAGLGELGVTVGADPVELFAKADAVIDFTAPAASAAHAELAAQAMAVHVIGTTGLSEEQNAVIAKAALHTAVVQAPNMSLGVNLLMDLVERVAGILEPDYDIEIVEMHHRHKVDAPSGTALALGRAAAAGRRVDLDSVAQKVRDGVTGERKRGGIGFATLRGGDVTGEHTVIFATPGERVELSHKASSPRGLRARRGPGGALGARQAGRALYDEGRAGTQCQVTARP